VALTGLKIYPDLFENMTPPEIIENLVRSYWGGQWKYVEQAYKNKRGFGKK